MRYSPFLIALICLGGIYLLFFPFFAVSRPRWSKIVVWIAGGITEFYVGLGFIIQHLSQENRWFPFLSHLRSMLAGITLGLLFAYVLFLRATKRLVKEANGAALRKGATVEDSADLRKVQ